MRAAELAAGYIFSLLNDLLDIVNSSLLQDPLVACLDAEKNQRYCVSLQAFAGTFFHVLCEVGVLESKPLDLVRIGSLRLWHCTVVLQEGGGNGRLGRRLGQAASDYPSIAEAWVARASDVARVYKWKRSAVASQA